MKSIKKLIAVVFVALCALSLAACAGGGAEKAKTYTWDGTSFTVKSITEEGSTDDGTGKKVCVTIDFGENQMSASAFDKNLASGKLTLNGVEPESTYEYHMGPMVFDATNGFEQNLTGEAYIYFDMDKDYEINENDLVITE